MTEAEDDTFRYLVNNEDGEKIIVGLSLSASSLGEIVIPEDVTIIAPNAFKNHS
ncbi:MAG: hypothetical protein MJ201_03250 [Mycoplasmoidaceae bacterium]|nr:hypothetical protein [Mycoplasmoidaceae bacterium]